MGPYAWGITPRAIRGRITRFDREVCHPVTPGGRPHLHVRSSACPTIVDLVGYLFADRCQLEKFLLDEGVFCLFSKFSIFGRLFSKVVRVVHAASRLFDWTRVRLLPKSQSMHLRQGLVRLGYSGQGPRSKWKIPSRFRAPAVDVATQHDRLPISPAFRDVYRHYNRAHSQMASRKAAITSAGDKALSELPSAPR